jgi:hypothetical protein
VAKLTSYDTHPVPNPSHQRVRDTGFRTHTAQLCSAHCNVRKLQGGRGREREASRAVLTPIVRKWFRSVSNGAAGSCEHGAAVDCWEFLCSFLRGGYEPLACDAGPPVLVS